MLDGEFKVMGMAPYGDPKKYDFSRLIEYDGKGDFKVNNKIVNVIGSRRYKENGKGFYFSPELIEWLGKKRQGDEIDDPYIDYAASIQHLLENTALGLIKHYLGDIIKETGKIAYAGGVALNVKLNQRIIAMDGVKELFVQPAAGDNGTSLGAASFVAAERGEKVEKLEHVYLGPKFTTDECIAACNKHEAKPKFRIVENQSVATAKLLADGHPVAWFQGRMEFGPRALGCRSILGNPSSRGAADRINAQIKFRERWRPFCPSMNDYTAESILQSKHPSPYMTFTFDVNDEWKARIPEVVHEDGTARAQIVTEKTNPVYYKLIQELEKHNGNAVVLNTSLNRRGEPMICAPVDALNMFYGCDLQYLMMENVLVVKEGAETYENEF